jgi:transcription elongation factor GreA
MDKIPITRPGYEKLKKELEHMKKVAVPENIRDIEEARGHGDITENAEYAAAKERQSFIQGKIQELENNLASSKVIDLDNLTDERIVFGSIVTIVDTETEERTTYQLVGPFESDIQQNKISVTSPIGKGLIGKEVGDEVRVKTPRGMRILEIADIRVDNGKQPG